MKYQPSLPLDATLYQQGYRHVAGCDEAGRGPIAGPVVAAAVIFPQPSQHPYIDDSKKMTKNQREVAYTWIMEHATSYAIEVIDVATIDRINILEASRLGMKQALSKLNVRFDYVLTDAMELGQPFQPYQAIIKGDQQSFVIACASILAKVTRDRLMEDLDLQYPVYGFAQHKGYPTAHHLRMLKVHGVISKVHRLTFGPVRNVHSHLSLFDN
jgi:ribonuclease HII